MVRFGREKALFFEKHVDSWSKRIIYTVRLSAVVVGVEYIESHDVDRHKTVLPYLEPLFARFAIVKLVDQSSVHQSINVTVQDQWRSTYPRAECIYHSPIKI